MGVFSQLIEKRSFAVSESLPDNHWFFRWLGGRSEAGVVVNEQTALNTLMFVNCVSLLADTFATVPIGVYQRLDRGRKPATTHPLYNTLHSEPNPLTNSFDYRHQMMLHLATWGNHYSEIVRRRGEVVALWPYHPASVRLKHAGRGDVVYVVRDGAEEREIAGRDMLHLRGLAMSGVVGLPPLTIMRQSLGIATAAQDYGARFFANDARPSILLKHPGVLGEEGRRNLRDSFKEDHGGDNRGGVGVLEEGMDIVTLSVPPEDAQFLQTRQFEARQVAGFFRVPPHLISDVERSTSWGTGIEQQQIGFVVHTMQPWFTRAEQELTRKLIRPEDRDRYYVRFNVNGLMRGDFNARKEFYATGRQWGYFSANDVRELEDMNPVENGDVYLQPLNMVEAGYEPQPDAGAVRNQNPARVEQRARQDAEQRSIVARQRLASRHVALYRDVIARLIRIEKQEVGAQARRRSADDFEQWVRDYYYDRFPARVEEHMEPPVRTLMGLVADEVSDELDGDVPADDLDVFARQYVVTMAKRHCGDSRSRLLALLHEHEGRAVRQDTTLEALVDAELETWDDRVDIDAQDEAYRSSNAAALFAYGLLGVLALRWVATGTDPCDYCEGMNGRTVSTGNPFLAAGEEFAPGGVAALVSQSSIKHPPIHTGCQCVIAPG